ncbi:hypothetical protein D3C85_1606680 [compost metagenome]
MRRLLPFPVCGVAFVCQSIDHPDLLIDRHRTVSTPAIAGSAWLFVRGPAGWANRTGLDP